MQEMPTSTQEVKEENKVQTSKTKGFMKWFFESFIWLAVILFALDVITKFVAYYNLPVGSSVKVSGFEWLFQFTLTFNTGAAWGAGGDKLVTRIILCFISYAAAAFIIYYYVKHSKTLNKFVKAILMIVLAGDMGNLIDRTFSFMPLNTIYSKGVVDFIDITPLIKGFGIFNFADSCLCVGIAMLLVYEIVLMFKDKDKKEDEKKEESK